MKKYFFKELFRPVKICKECGVEFRVKSNVAYKLSLCPTHARAWWRIQWKKYGKKHARKPENKKKNYLAWKSWVTEHLERRRQIALESFHRNKHKKKNQERVKAYLMAKKAAKSVDVHRSQQS